MFDIKISLSSFRLCRRKPKSLATAHFFSPVNPKTLEITYPTTPSPPPTTPTHPPNLMTTPDKNHHKLRKDENDAGFVLTLSDEGVYRKVMEETLTVVQWSDKPYDDFKKSMLEMILEKKIFEGKDLEELLQCFLTLNHRNHHADIVAAFTEIWELLFVESDVRSGNKFGETRKN